ncbi:DUF805 domain-containing protein [Mesorhizobium sp. IMUNJ 23033]|uniref:DUF805 domain-containing protein n=1 Tax=Mesorhizobium sp. IMUNJ 23033 TaxID=3378039 RepID=UPI00384B3020
MDWKFLLTSYEGRINRGKLWACVGVIFVGGLVAAIIDNIIGTTFNGVPYGFVYVIYALAMLYSVFAVYAKRWHDRDKSGWWSLIGLVPIIGGIWMLVELGILEGTRGANQYGPDPLA